MLSPATPTSPIRVLIVDADRRVRDSMRDLICCEVGLGACSAVATADDARAAVAACEPEVVVIDPRLPDVESGLGLIDELRAVHPSTRLLIMTWADDADVTAHFVDDMLDKGASPEELVAAITRFVRKGADT